MKLDLNFYYLGRSSKEDYLFVPCFPLFFKYVILLSRERGNGVCQEINHISIIFLAHFSLFVLEEAFIHGEEMLYEAEF